MQSSGGSLLNGSRRFSHAAWYRVAHLWISREPWRIFPLGPILTCAGGLALWTGCTLVPHADGFFLETSERLAVPGDGTSLNHATADVGNLFGSEAQTATPPDKPDAVASEAASKVTSAQPSAGEPAPAGSKTKDSEQVKKEEQSKNVQRVAGNPRSDSPRLAGWNGSTGRPSPLPETREERAKLWGDLGSGSTLARIAGSTYLRSAVGALPRPPGFVRGSLLTPVPSPGWVSNPAAGVCTRLGVSGFTHPACSAGTRIR